MNEVIRQLAILLLMVYLYTVVWRVAYREGYKEGRRKTVVGTMWRRTDEE